MTADLSRFVPVEAFALFEGDSDTAVVDGSLCFVDISGFTALSEKLAAQGRVGAEELTEVLSDVFSEMVDIATARGGMLLKFGGDALLLLFVGDDHAMQAASAAVEMRHALARSRGRSTSVGKLSLRMSQGLHSGTATLFRIDGSHIELIVAGPTFSEVARMEGSANAGEIVVSDAMQALLPSDAVASADGVARLRWRTPRIEPIDRVDARKALTSPDAMIPSALCDYLTAGQLDSEHRQATVVFVDVVGVDDAFASGSVDQVSADIASLVTSTMAIAESEDVTFLSTDVDENAFKMILVVGVPATQEDEEGRALRVARRVADLETPFGLKVGVNRGHVFSGAVGSDARATFTIMGDTVNLAARLMAAAPQGQVYASPSVMERSRTLFKTGPAQSLRVKGKSAAVSAYPVGPESGTRAESTSGSTRFVGRDDELATLQAALVGLRSGTGGSIAVFGPTGIGKTRLVAETLSDHQGTVVEVRAEPYGSASPYRPFRDPVRDMFGVERGTNEDMSAALARTAQGLSPEVQRFLPLLADVMHIEMAPTEVTSAISGEFRQERTADVLISALDQLEVAPFVLIFEDSHWADDASSQLLDRLRNAASSRSWLLIETSRDEVTQAGISLEIGPLEEDEAEELIHLATENNPLLPSVVSAILLRAQGSPLFLEELLNALGETGDIESLPTSLDGVVGAQVDQLPPLSRRVLQYLSVLGRSFRRTVARELIASQGVSLDAATRASLSGFLDDDGRDRLQFRHALVRDVAYEGLSYKRRRALHLKAGDLVLERVGEDAEAVADILALHFSLGGDAPRAWKYAVAAGDRNKMVFANSEAASFYERALEAGRQLSSVSDDELSDVWIRLGDVNERSGDFDGALLAYQRAARLVSDDPLALGYVMVMKARAKERAGKYPAALADTTRAAKAATRVQGEEGMRLEARALGFAAVVRQAQQKPADALKAAIRAEEAGRAVGDEEALARAWRVMDYANVMLGEIEKATQSEGALEIYRRLGMLEEEAGTAANLGAYAYWRGDWKRALEVYEQGRDSLNRLGNVVDAAHTAANIGEVLVNQGRYEEAEEPLMSARRTYASAGFLEGMAFVDVLLGRMYGIQGNLRRSDEYLTSAIDAAREFDLDAYVYEASIHLADATCRRGDPSEALTLLASAQKSVSDDYVDYFAPLYMRVSGSILHSAGEKDECLRRIEEGLAIAEERGDDYEWAMLMATRKRISPGVTEADDWSRAQEILAHLGVREDSPMVMASAT